MQATTYKSNSKVVQDQCKAHVKEFYEDLNDLEHDLAVVGVPKVLVEGGSFLIYYDDQREFLNNLHLNNNSGREFTNTEVFELYKLLIGRAILEVIKEARTK